MERLTELGRRVLGHLPRWHEDEAWLVAEEGGPENSVRSYTLAQLVVRLAEDRSTHDEAGTPTLDPGKVQAALDALAAKGLCEHVVEPTEIAGVTHVDAWRMSQLGFEALNFVHEQEQADVEPGAVTVPLHPAVHESGAA